MSGHIVLCFLAAFLVVGEGLQASTNYDISRNRLGFGLREIAEFFLGGAYGQYPNYPSYPQRPGDYPNHPGAIGPEGAHPGCPLCDSSVYSYCSYKQIHDACCCENPQYLPFNCRNKDCKYLYANSCQEYGLITNCCCIDLQKQNVIGAAPAVAVLG